MKNSYIQKISITVISLLITLGVVYFIIRAYLPGGEHWVTFTLYITASNSFIAVPHEPLMIYYGKHYGILKPLAIAIVPTALGCVLDYAALTPILHHRNIKKNFDYAWVQKVIKYFLKWPFGTLVIFAISPLPFYPIRLLSVLSKFPVSKYASAVTIGRIPRYWILLYFGFKINLSDRVILLIFIVLIGVYLFGYLIKQVKSSSIFFKIRERD